MLFQAVHEADKRTVENSPLSVLIWFFIISNKETFMILEDNVSRNRKYVKRAITVRATWYGITTTLKVDQWHCPLCPFVRRWHGYRYIKGGEWFPFWRTKRTSGRNTKVSRRIWGIGFTNLWIIVLCKSGRSGFPRSQFISICSAPVCSVQRPRAGFSTSCLCGSIWSSRNSVACKLHFFRCAGCRKALPQLLVVPQYHSFVFRPFLWFYLYVCWFFS